MCDGSQSKRSSWPCTRYPIPAANAVAKIPYDSTAMPTWIVSMAGNWRAGTRASMSDGSEDAYSSRASDTPTGMKPIWRIG